MSLTCLFILCGREDPQRQCHPLEQLKTQAQLVNNQGTSHRLQANKEDRDKGGSLSYTGGNQG
jgi:hypothetical protein